MSLESGAKSSQDKNELTRLPYPVMQANITQDTPIDQASRPKAAQVTAAAGVKHSVLWLPTQLVKKTRTVHSLRNL